MNGLPCGCFAGGPGHGHFEGALQAQVLLLDHGEVVGEELPALDRPEGAHCGEERHLHGAQEHQCELGTQCHRPKRRAPSTWSLLHRIPSTTVSFARSAIMRVRRTRQSNRKSTRLNSSHITISYAV